MFDTQLGLRENPFLAGHHSRYIYPSQEHQEALAHLRAGIESREPLVLITGDGGTGKTTAVYDALGEWGSRAVVALITNLDLTRDQLLGEICLRFSVGSAEPPSESAAPHLEQVLSAVRARGESAILLLDDAQQLDRELLAEICLLSDLELQGEKLLQVFLVGRLELETQLDHPEMGALRQRVGIHYRMMPLSATETAQYIHHRVAAAGGNARELFPTDSCIEVFRISNGFPREINIVAGQALLNAVAEGSRAVTMEHVCAAELEVEFQDLLPSRANAVTPSASPLPLTPPTPHPMETPVAPRSTSALPREFASAHAPRAEAPVEPATRTMPAMEPEPISAQIPPMTPLASTVHPEPGSVPAPITRTISPPSPPDSDAPLQILPSWFDEVVARRQQIDDQETDAAPATAKAHPQGASLTPAEVHTTAPAAPTGAVTFKPLDPTPAPSASTPKYVRLTWTPAPAEPPTYAPPALTPSVDAQTYTPPALTPSADAQTYTPPALTPSADAQTYTPPALVPSADTPTYAAPALTPPKYAAPAPAQSAVAPAPPPSVSTPAFVPLAPADAAESLAAAPAVPVRILPPSDVPADGSGRQMTPVDMLTAKLRAEFVEIEERATKKRSNFSWLVAAALVVTAAIGAFLLIRSGLWTFKREHPTPAATSSQAPAPTTVSALTPAVQSTTPTPPPAGTGSAKRESVPPASAAASQGAATDAAPAKPNTPSTAAMRPPATGPMTETPVSTSGASPSNPPSRSTTATVAPPRVKSPRPARKPAVVNNLFGIAVGTYLDEGRAIDVRTSLAESAEMPAQVVTVLEDTVSMYRIVMGSFEDRMSAERAASDLVRRGLVDEARVVPIAPGSPTPP